MTMERQYNTIGYITIAIFELQYMFLHEGMTFMNLSQEFWHTFAHSQALNQSDLNYVIARDENR
jgi:hypothetical protein